MYYEPEPHKIHLSPATVFLRSLLLTLLVFITAGSWAPAQTCPAGIPDAECQALCALYNSTDGDNWTSSNNWFTSSREWEHVLIEFEDGGWHVTRIAFPNKNLTGHIPGEIGNLSHLKDLYFGYNDITGEIPPELGNLTRLETLYLDGNLLTGELPSELGNLTNLRSLHTAYNQLTGEIPPELANLANLEALSLDANRLTGEIPPELGSLPNLVGLGLSSNQLTGEIPPELANLANLEQLALYHNYLTGPIPPELGNLPKLRSLWIMANDLSGDLPAFLADPPEEVDLKWNRLYASNPDVLAAMEERHEGEFMSTQTVQPENVTAEAAESGGTAENRILVSWDPISYVADDGCYQVYCRKTGDTEYRYCGMTGDKAASSLPVANLEPGTEYEFMVKAVTWTHKYNKTDLVSEESETASATSGTLSRAFIPNWKQAPGYWTGVVASNFGDSAFTLNLAAYGPDGTLEPLDKNPASSIIEGGLQKSLLGSEFLGSAGEETLSWIELGEENSNRMGSIFLYGVSDTEMMDGAESQTSYARRLYFTRPLDEGFFAGWGPEIQMSIVNPTDEEVTVHCIARGSNGEAESTHTIPSRGFISGDSEDLVGAGHGIVDGYLEIDVTEGPGVVGFSRIEFSGDNRTALGMNAVEASASRRFYSAQLAHGMGIVTNLRLVNTGTMDRTVTLTAVGDTGALLAEPVEVEIAARQIYSADLGTLFGLEESEGVITTGSLVVESDGFGIIGDIIFAEGDTMQYALSLPLQDRLFQEAVFNHISNLSTVFTGFAFYNPGDATANVTVEAFGMDGQKVAEKTMILDPGERIARTLTDPDVWPAFPTQSGGYIKIRSDQPIAGQQLFGDRALRYMAAIPPTTRLEGMFD